MNKEHSPNFDYTRNGKNLAILGWRYKPVQLRRTRVKLSPKFL